MKLIVINALSALRGGGQTYLINFLEHLPEGDFQISLLVNSKNRGLFEKYSSDRIDVRVMEWASKSVINRSLWEFFSLPSFLKTLKADVYYAPGGVMITNAPEGVTCVTALQNMLPFDERERKRFPRTSYVRFKLWLLQYVFILSYKMSDKVVFISEYSQSVIKGFIPNIEKKSLVVPHGLDNMFLNATATKQLSKKLKENKFYLYVSILDVYKAQKEIIKAWDQLCRTGFDYPLVLVGPKYNNYGEEVIAMIDELSLQGKVIYLGKVDYKNLPNLYKSARALIFASSCECCPNILLEKLAAGKPVLCSNIQPMPEFGGDAVLYFDPYTPETLVQQVMTIENDQGIMKTLGEKASLQALRFNWSQTVGNTIEFLLDADRN